MFWFAFVMVLILIYIMYEPSKSLEQKITEFVTQNDIKCAQFIAGTSDKIILSINFGFEDYKVWNKSVSCKPDNNTLFRIASVSKTITAAAILGMVSKGILKLDTKLVNIMKDIKPYDKRVNNITIRDLLRHSAGWDTSLGITSTPTTKHFFPETITTLAPFDPQYDSLKFLDSVTNTDIITFMMQFPLNYEPGTRYVYSNFGYNILGRIIELLSGVSYEEYILKNILNHVKPGTAFIGNTLISNKKPQEVYYYDGPQDDAQYSWDCNIKYKVPSSYGTFDLKIMDSHGGWVMRVNDLKIFGNRLLNLEYFSKEIFNEIFKIPPYVDINDNEFYSLGMRVNKKKHILMHNGALTSGTFAVLSIHVNSGIVSAFVGNHLPINIGKTIMDYQKIVESSF